MRDPLPTALFPGFPMSSKSHDSEKVTLGFDDLGLAPAVFKAVKQAGYETPSPIQARMIPHVMSGEDVIGQAQTGTGKTAAFALPILSSINLRSNKTQALILAPTRELAIQVAEACQSYASQMKGFHVLPVYGGQDYRTQLRSLKRGAQIVVGTPGRVMDHMRRGTLKLADLQTLVLDEADEMLRMGFIDDVEWILEQTPEERQICLFSATMPAPIKKIAQKYLNNQVEITIKSKTTTVEAIRQRFWMVSGRQKMDVLTRLLEAEEFDGMIIFVRTKTATLEVTEKLGARGFAAAAINGDMAQKAREHTIDRLKKGKLDILVATDVAARGLDVERISHVINYDVPYDTESYVHRIGRTGRAGRKGDAILFIAPREQRLLNAIEKATKQKIEKLQLPTTEDINTQRIERFKQRITDTLESGSMEFCSQIVEQYEQEHNVSARDIAAALARMVQGDEPLLMKDRPIREERGDRRDDRRKDRKDRDRGDRDHKNKKARPERKQSRPVGELEEGMERYRIEVGHEHEVKPGNIVGAIANEAGVDSQYIGRIHIEESYSLIDLPEGMPKETFRHLKTVWVSGQQMRITRDGDKPDLDGGKKGRNSSDRKPGKKPGKKSGKKRPTSSERRERQKHSGKGREKKPKSEN